MDLHPMSTPLDGEALESALREFGLWEEFRDVVDGIRNGFSMGLRGVSLDRTFTPPNHTKVPEHLDFIASKYAEELALGRISGPYTREQLESLIGTLPACRACSR